MNISFTLKQKGSRFGGQDFCECYYDETYGGWVIRNISGFPILYEENFDRIESGEYIIENIRHLKK